MTKFNFNLSGLVPFLLAFIVFVQNPVWLIWDYYYNILTFLVLVLMFIVFRKKFTFRHHVIFFLYLVSFLYFGVYHNFSTVRISSFVTLLTILVIFNVDAIDFNKGLIILRDLLFYVVFISLCAWFLNGIFNFYSPISTLTYGEGKGDDGATVIDNYLFYIQEANSLFPRFYSVFDEPGMLGVLSAFILLGFKNNISNFRNFIIFLGGFFSFSLAFYSLFIISSIVINLKNIKYLIYSFLIIFSIVLFIFYLDFMNYSLNFLIFGRISNFSDYGIEQRMSDSLNVYYSNYIFSPTSIFGKGTEFFKYNSNLLSGQGYKIFIIEYGFFGIFLILLLYFSLIRVRNWFSFCCLIIFIVSFLQRPFLFTPWQIILFSMLVNSDSIANGSSIRI